VMAYPPDSMRDVELADELATLVAQLKTGLARHYAAGRWAAPGGPTPRRPVELVEEEPAQAVEQAAPELVAEDASEILVTRQAPTRRSLAQIRAELGACTRCKLPSTRRSIVFGVGDENAPLMFVGEGPGEQEDKRGEPFVGPAGELLDRMIDAM